MQNFGTFNILDKEFNVNMKSAHILVEKLTGDEKIVALNWLNRLTNLPCSHISIKKDRNHFLGKLLEVLKRTVLKRVMLLPKVKELSPSEKIRIKNEIFKINESLSTPTLDALFKEAKVTSQFMSMWSNDRRTYVAAKPIPGRGALIYMAVSEKPELGWIIPEEESVTE